jgi:hypothetical protein
MFFISQSRWRRASVPSARPPAGPASSGSTDSQKLIPASSSTRSARTAGHRLPRRPPAASALKVIRPSCSTGTITVL